MLAFSLHFVGPLSDVVSVEHVGVQPCRGKGGSGKSAIGVAASSAWGWDPDPVPADRNGFGQSWNSTVNNLERVFSGYNQTTLFLNETGAAGGNTKQAAESILEAIMKMEGFGRQRASGRSRDTPNSSYGVTDVQAASPLSAEAKVRCESHQRCLQMHQVGPVHIATRHARCNLLRLRAAFEPFSNGFV